MAKEIERKFLVKEIPTIPKGSKTYEIEQYYTSIKPEIRFRKVRNINSNQSHYYLTRKGIGAQIREEIETSINETLYTANQNYMKGRVIRKIRTRIPINGNLVAELDVYQDIDLKVVEVEFENERAANEFIPPDWFGEEVTRDYRYKNKNLATVDEVLVAN